MREIITVQIGQCGNQVGIAFWDAICKEHAVDTNGRFVGTSDSKLERIDVFFNEATTGRFVPRCILVDMDPSMQETIQHDGLGSLFRPDHMIWGDASAANNWAKGHGTTAMALMDPILDAIRRSAEAGDSLQGLQMWHSIGGGTGSGLGGLIAEAIKDEYASDILSNVVVFPSALMSDTVVEPYNATLAFHSLLEYSDSTFVIDNEALYGIATKSLRLATPAYEDINRIVATAMSGVTASMRFPGILNSGLRKLSVNLCPFPRLHFFSVGCAPLSGLGQHQFRRESVAEITKQMFSAGGTLCGSHQGRYLATSALFRGHASTSDIDKAMQNLRAQNPNLFVDWMPSSIQTAICELALPGSRVSSTLIGNGSTVCSVFDRIAEQFSTMLSKKAFLHWYTAEGVDEIQFSEAENDLRDVTGEYRQYETAGSYDADIADE